MVRIIENAYGMLRDKDTKQPVKGHLFMVEYSDYAALEAKLAERVPTANCCVCGRIVDTREVSQGGDKFGCQIDDERWSCSPECWETIVDPDTAPPAPRVTEAIVTAMIESLEGIAILSRSEARQALTAAQEAGKP